jgi:hypothetical protein
MRSSSLNTAFVARMALFVKEGGRRLFGGIAGNGDATARRRKFKLLREFSGQEKAFKFRIQHFPPLAELFSSDFPGCN